MERWSSIDKDDVELAKIRIYNHAISTVTGKSPRIILQLPPNPDTPDIPGDEYEVDMLNNAVKNQIVVAEREKYPGTASRARTTVLTGRVKHDLQMRPRFSEKYRQRLRERSKAANTSSRPIQYIENAHPGGRGGINMLTSGVANAGSFADLVVRVFLYVVVLANNDCAFSDQNQSFRRASSSGWLVCLAISCSTCCLVVSARKNIGLSSCLGNEHSNLRST